LYRSRKKKGELFSEGGSFKAPKRWGGGGVHCGKGKKRKRAKTQFRKDSVFCGGGRRKKKKAPVPLMGGGERGKRGPVIERHDKKKKRGHLSLH